MAAIPQHPSGSRRQHVPAGAIRRISAWSLFGLIITDGFSQLPQDVLANAAVLLAAAGTTPVALFTAHRIERDAARVAGFRDLIARPFDLETFEYQVRTLLSPSTPGDAGAPRVRT